MLLEQSQAPVLFEIRGDIFADAHDNTSASMYFEQARSLWPRWRKSYIEEARADSELGKNVEAIQLYNAVLTSQPNHAVAKIEMGVIEVLKFDQFDKGLEYLSAGLNGERVPRPVGV